MRRKVKYLATVLAIIVAFAIIVYMLKFYSWMPIPFRLISEKRILVHDAETMEPLPGVTVEIIASPTAFHYMGDVVYIDGTKGMDYKITTEDLEAISDRHGAEEGSPNYDSWFDLNKDGYIGTDDINIAADNAGLTLIGTFKSGVTDENGYVTFTDIHIGAVVESRLYNITVYGERVRTEKFIEVDIYNLPYLAVHSIYPPEIQDISISSSVSPFEVNVPITFKATVYDRDGTIVSYVWDFGDGYSATSNPVSHTYESCGTYTVKLTVTDNDGLSSSDTVAVRVTSKPIAYLKANPTSILVNSKVNFDASNSYDPDGGTITSYYWNFGDGQTTTTTSSTVSHTYSSIGTFTATVTVTDDEGQKSSHSVSITVYAEQGYADFTYSPDLPYVGETVNFDASSSKASTGATITAYKWDFNYDGIIDKTVTNPVVSYSFAYEGTYTVKLIVEDSNGYVYEKVHSVEVIVQPVADFTYTGDLIEGGTITLDASPSVGKELQYEWLMDGENRKTGITATYELTYGTHTFTLTVTDIRGTTDTKSVTVTVSSGPVDITLLTNLQFPPNTLVTVKVKITSSTTGDPVVNEAVKISILPVPEAGYTGTTATGSTDSSGIASIDIVSPPSSLYTYTLTVECRDTSKSYSLTVMRQLLVKTVTYDYEQTYKPGDYDFLIEGKVLDKESSQIISDASLKELTLKDNYGNIISRDYIYYTSSAGLFTVKAKVFDYFKSIDSNFNYEKRTLTLTMTFYKAGFIDGKLNVTVVMSAPTVMAVISSTSLTQGADSIVIAFKDKSGNPYEGLLEDNVEVIITTPSGKVYSTRNELKESYVFDVATKSMLIAFNFDEIGEYKITVKYYDLPFSQSTQSFVVTVKEPQYIPPILTNPIFWAFIFVVIAFLLLRKRKK